MKKKFEDNYEEHVCWVQFHPSYSYEDFIEGIKPIGISNESVNLKLVNGKFKNFCKKAKGNLSEEYYFVADEINRANLSAVFGETLSLLESGYRDFRKIENDAKEQRHLIETQYSELERNSANSEIFYEEEEKYKGKFGVPRNIRFIGMMNDVDKSIDAFDLALRRRFKWVRMDCDYSVIRDNIVLGNVDKFIISCAKLNYCISGCEPKESQGLSDEDMQKVKQDVSSKLELGASYEFGHANFLKIKDVCRQNSIKKVHKEELFDGYLKPTLKEYLRSLCPEEGKLEKKLSDARNVFVKEIVEKIQSSDSMEIIDASVNQNFHFEKPESVSSTKLKNLAEKSALSLGRIKAERDVAVVSFRQDFLLSSNVESEDDRLVLAIEKEEKMM